MYGKIRLMTGNLLLSYFIRSLNSFNPACRHPAAAARFFQRKGKNISIEHLSYHKR